MFKAEISSDNSFSDSSIPTSTYLGLSGSLSSLHLCPLTYCASCTIQIDIFTVLMDLAQQVVGTGDSTITGGMGDSTISGGGGNDSLIVTGNQMDDQGGIRHWRTATGELLHQIPPRSSRPVALHAAAAAKSHGSRAAPRPRGCAAA